MSDSLCRFCTDEPATDGHHPTGRGPDGASLDPGFTVRTCHACNCTDHRGWAMVGLDCIADPSLARLRRAAFLLAKLEAVGSPLPAESCGGLARSLNAVATDLLERTK